jgi:broad specificity phosphatase PhoE
MIFIVRHGQTVWNLAKRKQGRKDSPLTLKGIEQARLTAKLLDEEIKKNSFKDFKIVISPQWRCQQYASIICELIGFDFMKCIHEEDLREHSFGLWEGKNEEEIEDEFPGYLDRRYKKENYWNYIVPMGESYELLSKRVERVLKKYKDEKIIYICHEMVSKVMRGNLMKLEPKSILPLSHKQNLVYFFKDEEIKSLDHLDFNS